MGITYTAEELMLDFMSRDTTDLNRAHFHHRFIVSLFHAKRLLNALTGLVAIQEKRFGEIKAFAHERLLSPQPKEEPNE